MKNTKRTFLFSVAGFFCLVATVAYAAGYQRIPEGWLKIGQTTTTTKKLEFDTAATTDNVVLAADSSENLSLTALSLRLLERPTNGVNYIELSYPASQAGNTTLTIPAATDTLVARQTSESLLNKNLDSSTNTYRLATSSISGAVSTTSQEFAGDKTFLGPVIVGPTGTAGSIQSTNGVAITLGTRVLEYADDWTTAGAGNVIFNDTTGGSFNQYFGTINSAGNNVRTAGFLIGGTSSAGSETGSISFQTKPAGGTAQTALSIDSTQLVTFVNAPKVTPFGRGKVVSDTAGLLASDNLWTSAAMVTTLCTTGTCSGSISVGGGINSISWSAVGTYDVNFTSSYWSAGPVCTASHNQTSVAGVYCGIKTPATTTKVVVECATTAGSTNNLNFNITCTGTRS